jgi:hypothetical protein
VDVL